MDIFIFDFLQIFHINVENLVIFLYIPCYINTTILTLSTKPSVWIKINVQSNTMSSFKAVSLSQPEP